jgi:N-succinyldiaminopimelate aminotransferase
LNPRLSRLQPCSFERLRHWFADVTPNPALVPISLSIGEPRHATPVVVADALAAGMSGLANYPTTLLKGRDETLAVSRTFAHRFEAM